MVGENMDEKDLELDRDVLDKANEKLDAILIKQNT